ncbi:MULTISPECIES: hydantoinase/oxoprolinase family protein [unclassified Oleiphilus]|uniref:hydantoinase/oxoprolinase family protein n=2 Tax=Oleiphilus TaxID=141450 RepID=UPI000AA17226|nr:MULTISPECIES: hydantoinase/oxoprolinase family protein [unclassified Oleiphilus]
MSTKQGKQIKHLGVDAGGTFTDFVLIESDQMQTHKVLSTSSNPAKAIIQGILELGLEDDLLSGSLNIIHGSTVATNAALEGKGARTAYIANKGFKDVLSIGRQNRKELYNLKPVKTDPPVPPELCFEVDCRRDAQGNIITPLSDEAISQLVEDVKESGAEAIAINLLFSFLNSEEEQRIESALNKDFFVSRSSFVLPVYKEYERGIATWLNASLGPKVNNYLSMLQDKLKNNHVQIMQSSGGLLTLDEAKKRAVNLLLSGPAGGLSAVRLLGKSLNQTKILSFDMGGTSTDVSLMDGDFLLSSENSIADWPVAIPMLDMDTIGAGGGSIAWIDEAGMLHVGPESAGSNPGPACYGQDGDRATVTDANLILGHIPRSAKLGGSLSLDFDKAIQAIEKLAQQLSLSIEETAQGIVQLAEQQMSAALHNISVKQGHSPKDFSLCCFGGAGGMHVCSLAEKLNIKRAIIPRNSGVLSAFGMLTAAPMRNATHSYIHPYQDVSKETLADLFDKMKAEIAEDSPELAQTGKIKQHLDLRYLGQSYTIEVPYSERSVEEFEAAHEQRFGHRLNKKIELVNLKLSIEGVPAINSLSKPMHTSSSSTSLLNNEIAVIERDHIQLGDIVTGPAIITEKISTTWIPKAWQCELDRFGNLLLSRP